MLIGMFVKQKEKEMQIRIDKLNELIDNLRKRNRNLMEECGMTKNKQFIYTSNTENKEIAKITNQDYQTETSPENRTIKGHGHSRYVKYLQNRSSSEGISRVVRRSKEIKGNVIVSTTKISYKRRNQGNQG